LTSRILSSVSEQFWCSEPAPLSPLQTGQAREPRAGHFENAPYLALLRVFFQRGLFFDCGFLLIEWDW